MYSKALEEFPDGAITAVLTRLAKSKREEYEPRIPELGNLIEMVRTEAHRADKPVNCDVCNNSRYRIDGTHGERKAVRCECWLDWKARQPRVPE
jgi:hypothetical protein